MPAGIARRLECGKRSVLESAQKRAGVVDSYRLDAARQTVFSLFDEGFRHRGDFDDRAIEPHRRVKRAAHQLHVHAEARVRRVFRRRLGRLFRDAVGHFRRPLP